MYLIVTFLNIEKHRTLIRIHARYWIDSPTVLLEDYRSTSPSVWMIIPLEVMY
jgi:hypothetical protein